MKIGIEDFNSKLEREDIFKLTIKNKSLYQDSKYNGARIVNFTISKNLVVKRTLFLHTNLHADNLNNVSREASRYFRKN
jgi:hypothetical protein